MNDTEQIESAARGLQLQNPGAWYSDNIPGHFHTSQLSQSYQALVRQVVDLLQQFQTEVHCNEGVAVADVPLIVKAIELDYPEVLPFQLSMLGIQDKRIQHLKFDRKTQGELTALKERISQWSDDILTEVSELSQIEQTMYFYKVLAGFQSSNDSRKEFNSLLCVLQRKSTAMGLACAFEHLCTLSRIPCVSMRAVVNGKYQHYFNIIHIEGAWCNVDCGIAQQMRGEELTYAYFGFPDSVLAENMVICGAKLQCTNWICPKLKQISVNISCLEIGKWISEALITGSKAVDMVNLANRTLPDLKSLVTAGLCCSKKYGDNEVDFETVELNKFANSIVFRLLIKRSEVKNIVYENELNGEEDEILPEMARFIARGLGTNVKEFIFFFSESLYNRGSGGGQWLIEHVPTLIKTMREELLSDDSFGSFKYLSNNEARMVVIWF